MKATLHSVLVYEPGQFFLPHKDSEKADEMVGTLVVTLFRREAEERRAWRAELRRLRR